MFKGQQVLFWHFKENKYMTGILIGDTIICACCGECLSARQIEKSAPEGKQAIILMRAWKPFNEYIEVLKLN